MRGRTGLDDDGFGPTPGLGYGIESQVQSRPRPGLLLALLMLAVISIAARYTLLRARPLWHDEIFTAWVARLPTAELVAALRADSGPPLFYLLERPFARGSSSPARDALVRILPFLAGLALFAAARTLPRGAPRAWWIALAASFALINLYAAEARAYELLALLCLGLFLLGLRGGQTPGRMAALGAIAAAALWTHYLALIAVAAALILALGQRRWRSAIALAAGLAAFAPWVGILLWQPAAAMAWSHDPPGRALPGFLSALGGVGRIPAPFGPPIAPALFMAGLVVGVALIVLSVSATTDDPEGRLAVLFVVLVLALSLAASLWRPIAFAGRCEMAALAVWIWALARAAPRRRALGAAAALAAAFGLGATLLVAAGPHPRSTTSSAAESLARLARTGDVVVAGPGFYLPFRLEADRGRLAARVASLPEGDAAHPGWFVAWPLSPEDVRHTLRVAEELPSGARLFLLLPPVYNVPALMTPLGERGVLRELVRQNDGVLTVWEAPAKDAPRP